MSGLGMQVAITDEATPEIVRVALETQPARLLPRVGQAVAGVVREHLVKLDQERHRDGGHNFYFMAAQAVHSNVEGDHAVVSINQQGIAQRYFGGHIVPVEKEWLALPNVEAHPETYGKRPGDFSELTFRKFSEDVAALVYGHEKVELEGGIHDGSDTADVYFWLVKEVNQAPDPTVLPTAEKMRQTAIDKVTQVLARDSRNGGAH